MSCPPLWSTRRRPERTTWASPSRLAALEELLATRWMPWQADVLATALEVDPATGLLAYPTVGLSVGRQEGKSTLLDGLLLLRCARRRQRAVYLCQDRQLAAERLLDLADGRAARRVAKVVRSNGKERVTFMGGSRWSVVAATAKAGRGRSLDLVVVDEAALLPFVVIDAVGPTQAARVDPQLWITSNAGDVASAMFWSYTELGRDAATVDAGRGMAWFEWGALDGEDRADPATWAKAMPSLGSTISDRFVAAKLVELAGDPERFDREYLNRWPEGMGSNLEGLDKRRWAAAARPHLTVGDQRAFAFDIAADRSSAAIAQAGPIGPGGQVLVEVIAWRPGTGWLVDAVRELHRAHPSARIAADDLVCADAVAQLRRRHIDVDNMGATDIGRACLAVEDLLDAGALFHRSQSVLDRAVVAGRRRHFGDAWAWSRARSRGDIAPLVAVTLAAWSWRTSPPLIRPAVIATVAR